MTTTTSATDNNVIASLNNKKSSNSSTDATATSDRFLKLLVTQLQNQDPLNPMDNAQVTSQMAQINTVTGIEKINTTMTGITNSFSQMQILQGASLVGHQVLVEGNKLTVDTTQGIGVGAIDLASAASSVKIDILDASGTVVGTVDEGAMTKGRHSFQWTVPDNIDSSNLTFKVTATSGTSKVTSTSMMVDTVNAVSNADGTLNLELTNSGTTAYSKVKAIA